jgi:hypothetical protein
MALHTLGKESAALGDKGLQTCRLLPISAREKLGVARIVRNQSQMASARLAGWYGARAQ